MGSGAFWFGVVIGFVTYRTLHHKKEAVIGDLAAVFGAIGGAAVLSLFPLEGGRFDEYAFGLAFGFFLYLVISLVISLGFKQDAIKLLGGDRESSSGLSDTR